MPTFTNQGSLILNGVTLNSNTVTGELVGDLTVTKTAVNPNYSLGNNVSYIISLINNGTTDITGLTVSDNLGGYTVTTGTAYPLDYVTGSIRYFINGALQAEPTVTSAPLTVTNINVPAGGNTAILYTATVNEYAPLSNESIINNEVTVTGEGRALPITDADALAVANSSNLSITKTMSPTTVSAGDTLTYTFIIQNNGNSAVPVSANALVTDTLEPILNPLTVTFNGTAWTEGTNYTYSTATGEFETLEGQISVPAATYTQAATGEVTAEPGVSTLVLTGTVA